jgi:D-glycero-D-manno-heptose 1,7-bisphosphate phosphatase
MGEHQVTSRAVFLDRDGVLNKPVVRDGQPFPPSEVAEFEIYPDVIAGCAELKAAGFLLIVVTNQPDVGRGIQNREAVVAMHDHLRRAVPSIDAIEVCFHGGSKHGDPCDCRKPKPGMLERAAAALDIELSASWMVGDRWRDIDCARAAGCRAIFIDHGYREPLREKPDFTVANFAAAVDTIVQNQLSPSDSQD